MTDPIRLYDYLTMARRRVLDAVRLLTPEQYRHEFAFGLKTIGSTITHIMNCEWYFIERLEGRDVPPYEQWPIHDENPPAFEVVESVWHQQADRIRTVLAAQQDAIGPDGSSGWNRRITYLSFPDDTRENRRFHISATAGEYLMQLVMHEVHHRAQVMAMLRTLGCSMQDVDYFYLMFERREERGIDG